MRLAPPNIFSETFKVCKLNMRGKTFTESDLPQFQGEKINIPSYFVD